MWQINSMFATGLLAFVLVMSSAQQQVSAHEAVMLTDQEILAPIRGNGPFPAQKCASFMTTLEMLVAGRYPSRVMK